MEIEDRFNPSQVYSLLGKKPVKKLANQLIGGNAISQLSGGNGTKLVQGFLKHAMK